MYKIMALVILAFASNAYAWNYSTLDFRGSVICTGAGLKIEFNNIRTLDLINGVRVTVGQQLADSDQTSFLSVGSNDGRIAPTLELRYNFNYTDYALSLLTGPIHAVGSIDSNVKGILKSSYGDSDLDCQITGKLTDPFGV